MRLKSVPIPSVAPGSSALGTGSPSEKRTLRERRNKMSESLEQRLASLKAEVSELKDREAIREVIHR